MIAAVSLLNEYESPLELDNLRVIPHPLFTRRDVDADPQLLARFDLEVPVLLLGEQGEERQLPRVSPRLSAAQLAAWLQGQGVG